MMKLSPSFYDDSASAKQATTSPALRTVEDVRADGRPLDVSTQITMQSRFGHDFSRVQVYTGARVAGSAQAVNALAYMVGLDKDGREGGVKESEAQVTAGEDSGASAQTTAAGQANGGFVPPCDPKGLSRANYLKEPGTSKDDFGLTRLSGTVSVPVVHTSKTAKGTVLNTTDAMLPPLTSVYTTADTFIEGEAIFVGENTDCPSGKKYPLRWTIHSTGAQKIREAEQEHCADLQHAFTISLRRYADVVNNLAAKKTVFASQKAAENLVTRLVGPKPDTWQNVFKCLAKKTEDRDWLKWHTPRPHTISPRLGDSCNFARASVSAASLSQIGKTPSADLIKDCGEGPPAKGQGGKPKSGTQTKSAPTPELEGKAGRSHNTTEQEANHSLVRL